jgi:hypothetical protein
MMIDDDDGDGDGDGGWRRRLTRISGWIFFNFSGRPLKAVHNKKRAEKTTLYGSLTS